MIGSETVPKKYAELIRSIYPDAGAMSHREILMRLVYHYALKGDMAAVNFIAKRTEGEVVQGIELEQKTGRIIIE